LAFAVPVFIRADERLSAMRAKSHAIILAPHRLRRSERKKNHLVTHFPRVGCFKEKPQIRNYPSNGCPKLMRVHHARKVPAGVLPTVGDFQQVIVLGKQHAAQFGGPLKQFLVWPIRAAVFKGRQHVEAAPAQPQRNGAMYMMVHIERKAQSL
jgi:hypothetical protein